MTALELCTDMAASVAGQFGGVQSAERLPSKYFNYGVQVIAPDGTPTQRNPRYCATPLGASAVAQLLGGALQRHGQNPLVDLAH